ncbi:MAG: beta-galactosidase, partial [Armatimonadota bacterium]
VEWSFPASNLTWIHPDKQQGRLDTEQGLFYWRAYLRARYAGDLAALNQNYGTEYADFGDVSIVDYDYDFQAKRYADPDAKILDYQDFREWASMRYFRPQIAAIRAADPNHRVTISNHSRRPIGLWEGAARHFMGFSVPEQSDLVDYLTSHDNNSESRLREGQTIEDVVHASILRTRFCNAVKLMPVIIEEFTFASPDEARVAEGQERMVLGTIGHASGWMNWYMQYPTAPNQADMEGQDRSAILNDDFSPTPWGLRAQQLIRRLKGMDLSRQPAATVIEVDRVEVLTPRAWGPLLTICRDWEQYEHPIDFVWPRNQWIDLRPKEPGTTR